MGKKARLPQRGWQKACFVYSGRTVERMSVISVTIQQSGYLYYWDSMKTLVTIATCVTFIKLGNLLLDSSLERVIPWFRRIKYDNFDKDGNPIGSNDAVEPNDSADDKPPT